MMRVIIPFCLLIMLAACDSDETLRAYGAGDRTWWLTELNGKPFTATATFTFPEKNRIVGSAPCNSYSAPMTVPYPWFKVGPIAATKRACPELAAETDFFEGLRAASISEVLGDMMILSNTEGLSMVFTARD